MSPHLNILNANSAKLYCSMVSLNLREEYLNAVICNSPFLLEINKQLIWITDLHCHIQEIQNFENNLVFWSVV